MKPYLIIPYLLEQPTWGGDYILKLKKWDQKPNLTGKKIGQSYELYGESFLSKSITDSADPAFSSTLPDTLKLTDFITQNPSEILGKKIFEKFGKMPLLIKLNQALGNSFQLHTKTGQEHARWQPKPESWYFLEDGYISCGVQKNTDVTAYRQVCVNIEGKMRELSNQVKSGSKTVDQARIEAKEFIKTQNPWQFVNRFDVKKYDLIDLSGGGVHHSWEENTEKHPLGNIVYEVQIDVMDEFCTIRSFDQGKIKDDGSIREIHIDDYFQFLDSTPESNDFTNLKRQRNGNKLLQTPYYSLDILELTDTHKEVMNDSFHHLYVQEGDIVVSSTAGFVRLTTGHSCFIPANTSEYTIKDNSTKSVVLKTHIDL
jgi:mannose-6-phosphate isomerase class I